MSKGKNQSWKIEFGHSLSDLIGGKMETGFAVTGKYEDFWGEDFDVL